jgi:hypothetical protein
MLRSNGDLLYIGKASSLRKRVNSYFQKHRHTAEHILEMLTQARGLNFTVTPTCLEAALLEAAEIKRLSPPYNKALRAKDRDLVFTSRKFHELKENATDSHWLGPLPRDIVEPLAKIVSIVKSGETLTEECFDHWQSPDRGPDTESLRLGWDLFKKKYSRELSNPSKNLLLLGSRLWADRYLDSETDQEDGKMHTQPDWNPERVCRILENRLMMAIYWARRIRWFGLLSDSSLAWRPRGHQDKNRTLLVLRSGSVIKRETLRENAELPDPPWRQVSASARQAKLNVEAVDLLSVLTAELRRLVSADRELQVKVGPRSTLDHEKLTKLLKWV